VIYALNHAPADEIARLRTAIEDGGLEDLEAITRTIESAGGLEYTARLAQRERDLAVGALADLPDSAYLQALRALADFAISRTH
jgi:octaprenyl-diphosphate synthase